MSFSLVFLFLFIVFICSGSFLLLELNTNIVPLDLFFLKLDLGLGHIVLSAFLTGISIAIILELIYFLSKRKNNSE